MRPAPPASVRVRMAGLPYRSAAGTRAFTLVEVLAVIAIVALLMGVLIPGIGMVRAASREAVCAAQQRRLMLATLSFAQRNRENLPGINTTGLQYMETLTSQAALLGNTSPSTPASVFDWISPILGEEEGLSVNRAERTRDIFNRLGCPSTQGAAAALWGETGIPDAEDFRKVRDADTFRQISYLSPGPFHLAGHAYLSQSKYRVYSWRGPAVPPERYLPRLDRVGAQHSDKVFISDATRYVVSAALLDFDVNPRPRYYGSFTSSTPVYIASREFGRATQNPEFAAENHGTNERTVYPANARLSYRHRGGMMTARFDGSAAYMTEAETKRDATPWFPGGSVFTGVNATPESLATHRENEVLR